MRIFEDPENDFWPVHETVRRYLDEQDDLDGSIPGLTQLSRRTSIGPEAFAIRLFQPLAPNVLSRYEEIHSIHIPMQYRRVLEKINGASIFEFELFGIPPSMAQDPPLLDRSQPQPLDLATANQYWKFEFSAPQSGFHFGGAPRSLEENIGYFLGSNSIDAYRKSGELVGSWSNMKAFLSDEIARCERHYEEFEEFMCQELKKIR